jgi:hypothetical protein
MPNTRDDSFVPLTPAVPPGNRRADSRVTIISQAEKAEPFRPLAASVTAHPAAAPGSGSEPRVAVQREGDRVSSIQIQCGCGRMIELACVYETTPVKSS